VHDHAGHDHADAAEIEAEGIVDTQAAAIEAAEEAGVAESDSREQEGAGTEVEAGTEPGAGAPSLATPDGEADGSEEPWPFEVGEGATAAQGEAQPPDAPSGEPSSEEEGK
jgi:hypothetical protein